MEALIPILVILFIVAIAFRITQFIKVSDLRSSEESNIAQIESLRRELSQLREKLQSIRLGQYKPNPAEMQSLRSKYQRPEMKSEFFSCFFCDEAIYTKALVCKHCGRPNEKNMGGIKRNDEQVRRVLSRV